MNKNKILYRPRTADPSTLTLDNLLALANIITTSGIDHHHPPSLGVFTSVQITMLYLQENIRQQTLANILVHPNPLSPERSTTYSISLTWCSHHRQGPKTLCPNGYTYSMARLCRVGVGRTLETLCSGKHHRAGHNLQILTDQAGQIFYISKATTRINA